MNVSISVPFAIHLHGRARAVTGVATGLLLLAFASPVAAAEYHVSVGGDDAASGTEDAPWRSLSRIGAVQPGDVVVLHDGTWNEPLRVPAGRADAPITVRSRAGATPIVETEGAGNSVELSDHTRLEGLTVRNLVPARGNDTLVLANGDHISIAGCTMRGRTPTELLPGDSRIRGTDYPQSAVRVMGDDVTIEDNDIADIYFHVIRFHESARRTRVLRNRIHNFGSNALMVPSSGGAMRGLLVEGNRISGSLISDGVQTNADFSLDRAAFENDTSNRGIVIRGNVFYGFGENAVDLKGSSHVLVERNVFIRSESDNDGLDDGEPHANWARVGSGGTVMRGSNQSSAHVIIRHNVAFDNNGGFALRGNRPNPYGWYVYNNSLVGNVRHAYESRSTERRGSAGAYLAGRHWAFLNNIVVGQNDGLVVMHTPDGVIDHNLYFDAPDVGLQDDPWRAYDMSAWRELLERAGARGADRNSQWSDPGFVDAPTRPVGDAADFDFRLAEGSAAVDAGQALTRTTSAGSGADVTVADVGFFFDGYGVTEGDLVQVGDSGRARVLAVDTGSRTLTLDRELSWDADAPVSLPWEGAAPDIGACERGLSGSCWYAEPVAEPRVDAGPDREGRPGELLRLRGRVEPSGLPLVGWAVVEGPGEVTLSDPQRAEVDARFSDEGVYRLRLRARAGDETIGDEVVVTILGELARPDGGGADDAGAAASGAASPGDAAPGDDASGCAVSASHHDFGWGVSFALIGLATAARRRRRRHDAARSSR